MNLFADKENPYQYFPKLPKKLTWAMHPAARKCSKCKDGYRHPVGNCVLCGSGPAPGMMNDPPKKNDRMGKFIALGKLNMELLSNDHASVYSCGTGPLMDYGLKPGTQLQLTKVTYGFRFHQDM